MLDLYRMSADPDPGEIIRVDEVLTTTGLCRTMLYKLIREGTFPCQVCLGARAVGWRKDQVDDWKRNRPVKQAKVMVFRDDTQKKRGLHSETQGPARITPSKGAGRKAGSPPAGALNTGVTKGANVISLHDDSDMDQRATRTTDPEKAKLLSAAATEKKQITHLREENAQLREMLTDLAIQNYTLQSEVRKISMLS